MYEYILQLLHSSTPSLVPQYTRKMKDEVKRRLQNKKIFQQILSSIIHLTKEGS